MANKPQYSHRGHPDGHVLGIIASEMNQEIITARNLAIDINGFPNAAIRENRVNVGHENNGVAPDILVYCVCTTS